MEARDRLIPHERLCATFHGQFFDLEDALIVPAPDPPVPLIVGGRSAAAVARAAALGDGWLGIWVSSRRFAAVVAEIEEAPTRPGASRRPSSTA